MKTVQQHLETIADAQFQLRTAKDESRRDALKHRVAYAKQRLAELQGKDPKANRPLTDDDLATVTYDEYRDSLPFALLALALEAGLVPERFREPVQQDLAEDRRQRLLKHSGVVFAATNDPALRAQLESEAAEARALKEATREIQTV